MNPGALIHDGRWVVNTWQGPFPKLDSATDGFAGPAVVGSYPADASGLRDILGNVWEWCAGRLEDAGGDQRSSRRPVRGGSFLCAHAERIEDLVSARLELEPDVSMPNVGFRCVK
jgi:formylglycine-generating enzyme required for sulfatase activity